LVYDTAPLPDAGILARTGTDQFLLESGHANQAVPALATQLGCDEPGVYRVERQDATFLLTGARALDVLAQVCGIDVRHAAPRRLILTRLAGVNGGLLPETRGDLPAFRLWVEPSQAPGLWESLATIVDALGGRIVGTACLM
jgi:sarcosine oxidase subunit gamma